MNAPDSGQSLSFTIDVTHNGKRLDAALSELSDQSRSRIQQLIKSGQLRDAAGNAITQPSLKVREHDRYRLHIPPPRPMALVAEDIPLDILFEDADLLILNKPAGMVVHPAHGHEHGTLVHALLHHCPDLPGINGTERPGIVHRLDKDTSGSMVIAKSESAHRRLSEMFASHDLNREYLAWCRGVPRWHQQRIELPIGRHHQMRQKMAVTPQGRDAITDAEVEHIYGPFSQLRLTLHTGRTHQIRVHLSHEKVPILGDPVYARSYNPPASIPEPSRSAIAGLTRQALHAELLEFNHPITGALLSFTAPLPPELQQLAAALASNYG